VTAGVIAAGAFADDITCSVNPCLGTPGSDNIQGTSGNDEIHALAGDDQAGGDIAGDDVVYGGKGDDILYGDQGFDHTVDGQDQLFGGHGDDQIYGAGEADLIKAGPGKDTIDAREDAFAGGPWVFGVDRVKGGDENDDIDVSENTPYADHVDCGDGRHDHVTFNRGLDTIRHCEMKDAIG
jgi:Ca2+-binding RTX toxin-like protein